MNGTIIPIVIGALGRVTKGLLKGLEDFELEDKWRPSIENGHNIEKIPGDLMGLDVTQTPVKDSKGVNNNGGRVETIQTTALLRTAKILRRVLETWGDLLSLKLQWKTIS